MNKYFIIVLLVLATCCKSQNITTFSQLENNIREILFQKGYISQNEYSQKKGFTIYGTYQRKVDEKKLQSGIYDLYLGNHSPKFNFIYEQNKIIFLDIYSFKNFLESMRTQMIYLFGQRYCREIIVDYVKRLIRAHYSFNRNLKDLFNKNCEFPEKRILSTFYLNEIKSKIITEIAQKEDLKKEKLQLEKIENIAVSELSIYFGINEKEKLEEGVYSYVNINSSVSKNSYFILNGNDIKFLKMDSDESFIKSIQEIILFGEDKNICSEKTIWYIEQLFSNYMEDSCLSKVTKDLP
ncbi:hypothetical protein ACM46_19410 [Chryseobacterium angstadtii]|uniref:Uncharacterized protein n=1 Tax=Chryseobacterium angstadtii TaxID=558151 RepID=A0A0J7I0H8_9FLAO|nr:hypothetical protein [Chryseobacterium angstadtii]KMQ59301.1 hypothetical protein ACM46_19410 [Chryseobacterium angstadtii]